ncbi:hypothetical protein M413DRAFT_32658 [Hebeloma cylindrosporum]|uniref:Uncharacterized protein n=1 Tax=Hebeloma cylindrosporum TaxID=76867 RepID=A0A0C3BT54_HEBCY|nr:hypothetical protein M413DRAFT_32658 [Hebeloma cylindrosporum h7]
MSGKLSDKQNLGASIPGSVAASSHSGSTAHAFLYHDPPEANASEEDTDI